MIDRLEGPRAKIERAEKHLIDLKAEIDEFMRHDPYGIVPDDDSEPPQHIVRARVSGELKPAVALIVGDLFHNLRAAYDHLAWQLVLANEGTPGSWTEWPVCVRDTQGDKATARGKVRGMAKEPMDIIDRMQPYKVLADGGDIRKHPIYAIHQIDIEDKHHGLIVVGVGIHSGVVHSGHPGDDWASYQGEVIELRNIEFGGPQWFAPLKDGTELWRYEVGPNTNVDVHDEITFAIALDVPSIGKRQPVVPLCEVLIQSTRRVMERLAPFL